MRSSRGVFLCNWRRCKIPSACQKHCRCCCKYLFTDCSQPNVTSTLQTHLPEERQRKCHRQSHTYSWLVFVAKSVERSWKIYSVAYLGGGPRCDALPPLAGPWNFFTGDFIWKGAFFAIFQQKLQNSTMFDGLLRFRISEKLANLRFPLNIQKQKVFQPQAVVTSFLLVSTSMTLHPQNRVF